MGDYRRSRDGLTHWAGPIVAFCSHTRNRRVEVDRPVVAPPVTCLWCLAIPPGVIKSLTSEVPSCREPVAQKCP